MRNFYEDPQLHEVCLTNFYTEKNKEKIMAYWNIVLCKKNTEKNCYYSKMDSFSYRCIDGRLSEYRARRTAEKMLKESFSLDNYTSYTLMKGTLENCYDHLSNRLKENKCITDYIKDEFSVLCVTTDGKIEYHKNITFNEVYEMTWHNDKIKEIYDLQSERKIKDLNLPDSTGFYYYKALEKLTVKAIGE